MAPAVPATDEDPAALLAVVALVLAGTGISLVGRVAYPLYGGGVDRLGDVAAAGETLPGRALPSVASPRTPPASSPATR